MATIRLSLLLLAAPGLLAAQEKPDSGGPTREEIQWRVQGPRLRYRMPSMPRMSRMMQRPLAGMLAPRFRMRMRLPRLGFERAMGPMRMGPAAFRFHRRMRMMEPMRFRFGGPQRMRMPGGLGPWGGEAGWRRSRYRPI